MQCFTSIYCGEDHELMLKISEEKVQKKNISEKRTLFSNIKELKEALVIISLN
jgi:hypothetical protein